MNMLRKPDIEPKEGAQPIIVTMKIEKEGKTLYNRKLTIEEGKVEFQYDPYDRNAFGPPPIPLPKPKISIKIVGKQAFTEFLGEEDNE